MDQNDPVLENYLTGENARIIQLVTGKKKNCLKNLNLKQTKRKIDTTFPFTFYDFTF